MKPKSNIREAMRCSLCLEQKVLRNSHILPKFVYGPAFDETHTAVKVDLQNNKLQKTQTEFFERLLCAECEGKINKWETYFARVWFHKDYRLRPNKLEEKLYIISGFNYKIFKLFHLSVLWRAGVSSRPEFSAVRLGPHSERIRVMLLNNDPGEPEDYQFSCLGLRNPDTLDFYDTFVRSFEASKLSGHRVYSVIFGGVIWAYWVSNHTLNRRLPPCLQKDGTLLIAVQDWNKNISIQDVSKHVKNIRT